jgi:hypothetical protein
LNGAALYAGLAAAETGPVRKDLLSATIPSGIEARYSAIRQLIFGYLAAAVTHGIGAALGTILS